MQIIVGLMAQASDHKELCRHETGELWNMVKRSGLAAARDCKGSSIARTFKHQGECGAPLNSPLLIKRRAAVNKQNSRTNLVLHGARKSSCHSCSSGPRARLHD